MSDPSNQEDSKSSSVVISPPSAWARAGPISFYAYAKAFLDAADSGPHLNHYSPVPYYLYCHAIELALKAFLSAQGLGIDELKGRKLGHNLMSLLTKAKTLRLDVLVTLSAEEELELTKANDYYNYKGFDYVPQHGKALLGYPGLPNIDVIARLAVTLVSNVKSTAIRAVNTTGPVH